MPLLVVLAGLVFPVDGSCAEDKLTGFDHLIKVVKSERVSLDPSKIAPILDYVSSDRFTVEPQTGTGIPKSSYAYHGYESGGDLAKLLKYCYNPDIPSCAVMPSMIRLSSWNDHTGKPAVISPALWQRLENNDKPVVVRGMYYMENTPDSKSGAYYGYDSYRAVILMNYKGRNALITVLKQKDVSEVGKRGLIIGDETEMDYFYTGEQGLSMKGLGWVKSYLYDSLSVSVFIEDKPGGNTLRCGVFKWIRAGWAGKNIIRKSHVKKGLLRYASEFKNLMEGKKNFPSPDELMDVCNTFQSLPTDEMKKKVERLIVKLQKKCDCGSSCPKAMDSPAERINYVNSLTRMEMSSALIVEYVKTMFNKSERSGNIAFKPLPAGKTTF